MLCLCMSEVISFMSWIKVFALLICFLYVILHTIWSGKSLQLLCMLPFGILCLFAISVMLVKYICVCMLVGILV